MKRIVAMIIVLCLYICSVDVVMAMEQKETTEKPLVPQYEIVITGTNSLEIMDRVAKIDLKILPRDDGGIDQIITTTTLFRGNSKTVAAQWVDVKMKQSAYESNFTLSLEQQLRIKGRYYCVTEFKLYSGTRLKETIKITSNEDYYE